jgi:hypothetical protein
MPTIGTRFRLERSVFDTHVEAETSHHVIEHVVVLIANESWTDLQCDMSIAEVIADSRELPGICGADGGYTFGRSHHFDDASVFAEQSFPATQYASSLQ